MRVLIVHNEYGRHSGEEGVVAQYARTLTELGHEVLRFERQSASLGGGLWGKLVGFSSGLGNPRARGALASVLSRHSPDVVNVHNVYPLISSLALGACRRAKVPVLMTVHNYRLICPNGLLYSHGEICERCLGGKEYNCILRNCEGSLGKSIGYAARSTVARWRGDFARTVSLYAALTEFQRDKLIESGVSPSKVTVVPNCVFVSATPPEREFPGEFVAFVGRVCEEKGIPDLLAAARQTPDVPIHLYGHTQMAGRMLERIPANVRVQGPVTQEELVGVYRRCRLLVAPSRCFEGFPLSVVEAMSNGCPVIGPAHGGYPSIIDDPHTGRLFRPGDTNSLAMSIREIWRNPAAAAVMGRAAHARALANYSLHILGERLDAALEFARSVGVT